MSSVFGPTLRYPKLVWTSGNRCNCNGFRMRLQQTGNIASVEKAFIQSLGVGSNGWFRDRSAVLQKVKRSRRKLLHCSLRRLLHSRELLRAASLSNKSCAKSAVSALATTSLNSAQLSPLLNTQKSSNIFTKQDHSCTGESLTCMSNFFVFVAFVAFLSYSTQIPSPI